MGSVIALIKSLLGLCNQEPISGARGGTQHILVGEDTQDGHQVAETLKETWDALPQMIRVFDRVDAFLKLRDQLHQACCGSALANRLMREMETAEADLQSAYNELLYPQAEYTPYKEKA